MLRRAGLALSLGALAAYGLRNAMADNHDERRLDATGPREVVFCHQCSNEWHRDTHGLTCPRCESEITEIINPETDPRPRRSQSPDSLPDLEELRDHSPWPHPNDDSDPEEADIEEHIRRGPNGGVFISRTYRSPPGHDNWGRRARGPANDPAHVISDFQNMIGNLMGPTVQNGGVGRSGPDDMFPPPYATPFGTRGHATTIRIGGDGPRITTQRFTLGGDPLQPRETEDPQARGPPNDDLAMYAPLSPNGRPILVVSIAARPDQLARILQSLLGHVMGPAPAAHDAADRPRGATGIGLQALLAQMLNPANAVHGDAVYSQEALDRIISSLMEQHPTSNAPGPAPAEAIAALPKTKLDEKMLGPELKGECSVCMDDVHVGDEVVSLPCKHWFHENCASAWLSEHNTCPICRKGIDGEEATTAGSSGPSSSSPGTRNEERGSRFGLGRRMSGQNTSSVGEDRLNYIRERGRLASTQEDGSGTDDWGYQQPSRRSPSLSPSDFPPPQVFGGSLLNGRNTRSAFNRRNSGRAGPDMDINRAQTSGSDHSRRSSASGNVGNGGGNGGPLNWIRDRLGSNRRQE
ncbi:hypothetical protein PVAG01_10112 [Phlyctema vagabunda]|uniref:RING-type domain-containing protein n=1 Tax=Phlyctema vagabunda TaxID=108571 RepID=A0ABR4P509_9HELO